MDKFRENLILNYLHIEQENYSIIEIASNLGLSIEKVDIILSKMIAKKLIKYHDYKLVLTQKGMLNIENNITLVEVDYDKINTFKIEPDNAIKLDEPYVPKKFNVD